MMFNLYFIHGLDLNHRFFYFIHGLDLNHRFFATSLQTRRAKEKIFLTPSDVMAAQQPDGSIECGLYAICNVNHYVQSKTADALPDQEMAAKVRDFRLVMQETVLRVSNA